jgi:hypothetical protein
VDGTLIEQRDPTKAAFVAYIDALAAYRIIMQRTVYKLLKEYGATTIQSYFRASSIGNLIDAHDSRFVSHRLAGLHPVWMTPT